MASKNVVFLEGMRKTARLLLFTSVLFSANFIVFTKIADAASLFDTLQSLKNNISDAIANAAKTTTPTPPASQAIPGQTSAQSSNTLNSNSGTATPPPSASQGMSTQSNAQSDGGTSSQTSTITAELTPPVKDFLAYIDQTFPGDRSYCERHTIAWLVGGEKSNEQEALSRALTIQEQESIKAKYKDRDNIYPTIARATCFGRFFYEFNQLHLIPQDLSVPAALEKISKLQLTNNAIGIIGHNLRLSYPDWLSGRNVDGGAFTKKNMQLLAFAPDAFGCALENSKLVCRPLHGNGDVKNIAGNISLLAKSGDITAQRQLAQSDPVARALNYIAGVPVDGSGIFFFYPRDKENGHCIYESVPNEMLNNPALGLEIAIMKNSGAIGVIDLNSVNYSTITFYEITGNNKYGQPYLKYESNVEGSDLKFKCDSDSCNPSALRQNWAKIEKLCKPTH